MLSMALFRYLIPESEIIILQFQGAEHLLCAVTIKPTACLGWALAIYPLDNWTCTEISGLVDPRSCLWPPRDSGWPVEKGGAFAELQRIQRGLTCIFWVWQAQESPPKFLLIQRVPCFQWFCLAVSCMATGCLPIGQQSWIS